MKFLTTVIALFLIALVATGCGGDGKPKPDVIDGGKVKVIDCYHDEDGSKDDTCWVEFPDGMVCLRSSDSHGEPIHSQCYGGRAAKYERELGADTDI